MDSAHLNTLLKQVQAELEQADSVDETARASLRVLARDIQALLDRSNGGSAPHDPSVVNRLQTAVTQFEVTHPLLTQAISQVIKSLADAGI